MSTEECRKGLLWQDLLGHQEQLLFGLEMIPIKPL